MTSLLTGNVQIPETKLQSLLLFPAPERPGELARKLELTRLSEPKCLYGEKLNEKLTHPG